MREILILGGAALLGLALLATGPYGWLLLLAWFLRPTLFEESD